MKRSISNIGWAVENDAQMYAKMRELGLTGLEIAPTRIFPEAPYEDLDAARAWAEDLKEKEGFSVPSMQSIWFGRQERIFGTEEERRALVSYTKESIRFAAAVGCKNLVFGCPRNRSVPVGMSESEVEAIILPFFRELGDDAYEQGTVLSLEANPPIYNTNYINDTASAIALVRAVDSPGFRLNLDLGTMIEQGEEASLLAGHVDLINHVHFSEPGLKPLHQRTLHLEVLDVLQNGGYQGFISIEMGKVDDLALLEQVMVYVKGLCA